MSRKKRDYAARNLARILKERTDPHGYPMNDEGIVRRLTISRRRGCKNVVETENGALSVLSS